MIPIDCKIAIFFLCSGAHRSEAGVRSQQIKDQAYNQEIKDSYLKYLFLFIKLYSSKAERL